MNHQIDNTRAGGHKLTYESALDGLRGISIIVVMIYHISPTEDRPTLLLGGFAGVDVFFFLSGFLITHLLVQEYQEHHRINLKQFYLRRVLRLLPALIFLFIPLLLLAVFSPDPDGGRRIITDIAIAGFYLSNWVMAFQLYELSFLAHTWSLAIEEQFYALWPLTLLFLLRRLNTKAKLLICIAVLIGVSLVWRLVLLQSGATIHRLYGGLDTRGETLLVGCFLGALFAYPPAPLMPVGTVRQQFILRYGAVAACFGLAFWFLVGNMYEFTTYIWGIPLVEVCMVFILLDIYLSPSSLIKPLLKFKPLVWTGKLSYALYLWHMPLVGIIEKVSPLSVAEDAWITVILSFVMAILSYHLIEQPALKLKQRFQPIAATG